MAETEEPVCRLRLRKKQTGDECLPQGEAYQNSGLSLFFELVLLTTAGYISRGKSQGLRLSCVLAP